jgi:hypothetical protein
LSGGTHLRVVSPPKLANPQGGLLPYFDVDDQMDGAGFGLIDLCSAFFELHQGVVQRAIESCGYPRFV